MAKLGDLWSVILVALSPVLGLAGNVAAQEAPSTIVTLGDSYINSYGVPPSDSFATKLKSELTADGHPATIVEVGFTSTSQSGLFWLTKSKGGLGLQADPANHVVIVELGQNDCTGIDLNHTRANLDQILSVLAQKRIPVLVVGTAAYSFCGPAYIESFSKMFSKLATKHGDLLYADFKEGVTGHPELLQMDRDHPNAAGDAIVARNMLPMVEALLAQVQPR